MTTEAQRAVDEARRELHIAQPLRVRLVPLTTVRGYFRHDTPNVIYIKSGMAPWLTREVSRHETAHAAQRLLGLPPSEEQADRYARGDAAARAELDQRGASALVRQAVASAVAAHRKERTA